MGTMAMACYTMPFTAFGILTSCWGCRNPVVVLPLHLPRILCSCLLWDCCVGTWVAMSGNHGGEVN